MPRNDQSFAVQRTILKLVLLGDGGVGKTSLIMRYVNDQFDPQCLHTVGVEFMKKNIDIDGKYYTLQIWDTAGQERFRSLRTPFYRGADICLLVFAMDDRKSFDDASYWRREFAQHGDIVDPANFPLILIGNKSDLSLQEAQISEDEVLQWCREYGPPYPFLLASAKTGENVETIFQTTIKIWKEKQEKLAADSSAASPTGQNHFHSNDTVDLNNQGSRRKSKPCC